MARRSPRRKVQIAWYGDDFLKVVKDHGDEALFAAGQIVLKQAEINAPLGRTGALRKSGYVSTASRSTFVMRRYWRKEKKPPANAVTVGFSAPHAHLIESGRRKSGRFGPSRRRQRMRSGNLALLINGRYVARSRYKRKSSNPFLGPAIEQTRETMVVELASVLRSRLERILGWRP